MKIQQEPSADHVARRAVRLLPSPRFTQQQRKTPARGLGMRGYQLPDKLNLGSGDLLAAVTEDALHAPERSREEQRTQAPYLLFFFHAGRLTGRHNGAAEVAAGSPPASNT
jgi:hypothetical protein